MLRSTMAKNAETREVVELANEVLENLEDAEPGAEEAWAAEVARRITEIDNGEVKCHTLAEFNASLSAAVRGEQR